MSRSSFTVVPPGLSRRGWEGGRGVLVHGQFWFNGGEEAEDRPDNTAQHSPRNPTCYHPISQSCLEDAACNHSVTTPAATHTLETATNHLLH